MSPKAWSRIQDLYEAALERPEGARAAFLDAPIGPYRVLEGDG